MAEVQEAIGGVGAGPPWLLAVRHASPMHFAAQMYTSLERTINERQRISWRLLLRE